MSTCRGCGVELTTGNPRAVYCTSRCKQLAYRRRQRTDEARPPDQPQPVLTVGALQEIQRAELLARVQAVFRESAAGGPRTPAEYLAALEAAKVAALS